MDFAAECAIAWDGAALAIVLFALPLAVIITTGTVLLYRRAVAKAMRHSTGDVVAAAAGDSARPPPPVPLEIRLAPATGVVAAAPLAYARAAKRRLVLAYALAGLAHSLTITALYLWLNDLGFRPFRTLLVWLPFAWPLVLTMTLTSAARRRDKAALIAGYFAVLVAADAAADAFGLRHEPGFGELVLLWAIIMGLPTLVIALLSSRAWRPVGLLALFLGIAFSAGYQLGFQGLGCLVLTTGSGLLLSSMNYLLTAVVLLLFVLAWAALRRLARRYESKRYSDQMLTVDSWWLLITAMETLFQIGTSGVAAFSLLLAFVAYKLVAHGAMSALRPAPATPRTLLLLRVFGFGRRTRRLVDPLAQYWRHAGPIAMIAGTDLASSLIEPHELLRFWRGELRGGFIANPADLAARLQAFDAGRDPDGRYRIAEFFCHDNTWQATVRALARRSDALLMDLRGFGKENRGCEFELGLLLDEVPLEKIVLLVDRTTRTDDLSALLQSKWAALAPASPNRSVEQPVLHLLDVGPGDRALRPLLAHLFAPLPA